MKIPAVCACASASISNTLNSPDYRSVHKIITTATALEGQKPCILLILAVHFVVVMNSCSLLLPLLLASFLQTVYSVQ